MQEHLSFSASLRAMQDAWKACGAVELPENVNSLSSERVQLDELLSSTLECVGSGFAVRNLRQLISGAVLEAALSGQDELGLAKLLGVVVRYFSVDTEILPPGGAGWINALAIATRLQELWPHETRNDRLRNVESALKRLVSKGHAFNLAEGKVDRTSPGFQTATAEIMRSFDKLGQFEVFQFIEQVARSQQGYHFDQVLFGRNPSNEPREAGIPFGFLWQLAARTAVLPSGSKNPERNRQDAFELSRDLIAVIDIETYGQFWAIAAQAAPTDAWLADAVLHDHLFSLQQWSPYLTPIILRSFFGTGRDDALRSAHGWGVEDVAIAAELLVAGQTTSPRIISAALFERRLPPKTVTNLLRDLTHEPPAPNAGYTDPFAAGVHDLMFRPFLSSLLPDKYTVPSMATVGPAIYEVVAAAARNTFSKDEMAKLSGEGLENATRAVLEFRGIVPTIIAAKYLVHGQAGECDLVLEDDETIIFIECKAKAMPRGAMAGAAMDAVFTYIEGIASSQSQALQHQSLLEAHGRITFENGKVLEHVGRKIVRLSTTLFDFGTLQDRFVFSQLSATLANSKLSLTGAPNKSAQKRVNNSNAILQQVRQHLSRDTGLGGDVSNWIWVRSLSTASLSLGQLATILIDHSTVSSLAEVIRKPATFATGSVLKEYHYLRVQRLV